MKKIRIIELALALVCLSIFSCNKISVGELTSQVKEDMQNTLMQNSQSVEIVKLTLVHVSGNNYEGNVILSDYFENMFERNNITMSVYVVYDGNAFTWTIQQMILACTLTCRII